MTDGSKECVSDAGYDVTAATSKISGGKKKQHPALAVDGAPAKKTRANKPPPMDATGLVFANPELKPHPFFYYSDHSLEQDDDPLTPVTAAGIVPTFPASEFFENSCSMCTFYRNTNPSLKIFSSLISYNLEMHAILANPELADVVGWDPHGRSWRILKPRDFEIRILPRYFEHSKFSSFVRQANGWGFRRMSEGPDKNAYYHEYFLRAMPWLCKKMRRPKVAEKKAIDPEMEPDLNAISVLFPVPDGPPTSEILVLQKTIEMGPRARMPVVWDTFNAPVTPSSFLKNDGLPKNVDMKSVDSLKRGGASCGDLKPAALPNVARSQAAPVSGAHSSQGTVAVTTVLNLDNAQRTSHVHNIMPHYARDTPIPTMEPMEPTTRPPPNNTIHGNHPSVFSSDSQIAANFVAASAIHAHHIHIMLSNAFVSGMPVSEAVNQAMPYAAAATAARMGDTHHGAVSMGQLSHYLQAQQSQHLAPTVNSNSYGSGVTNMPNPVIDDTIQRMRQFEAYRAGGNKF